MNANLSCFSARIQIPVPVATLSVQKTIAEIEELSLRTPRPVAIYLCESEATATGFLSVRKRSDSNNTRLSDQLRAADAMLALRFRAKNICRPKHKADPGRNYAKV